MIFDEIKAPSPLPSPPEGGEGIKVASSPEGDRGNKAVL